MRIEESTQPIDRCPLMSEARLHRRLVEKRLVVRWRLACQHAPKLEHAVRFVELAELRDICPGPTDATEQDQRAAHGHTLSPGPTIAVRIPQRPHLHWQNGDELQADPRQRG